MLTERQTRKAISHAKELVIEWTNHTAATGTEWSADRVRRLAHSRAQYADLPADKKRHHAAILADALARNFLDQPIPDPERTPEEVKAAADMGKLMDRLDEVYERDTRPCLEGKPSVKVTMTKDGPQALLEGFDPPPVRKGDADQLTMF